MGVHVRALEEALAFLFARTTGGVRFGLGRTRALLDALGNPHGSYPVIHVAGTNGKGSSLATAEALLRSRGLRVGKYTSPHLVDFRERVIVDGAPIDGDEVVEFVERWTPLVEQLGATFFEATTALAFDAFARSHVDVALVETGLGGRLDSTNVVDPICAGVTNIGWDHMEYLGHTLEEIASEKAGIFKQGRPAVIGERDPALLDYLRERAVLAGATPVVVAEEVRVENVQVDARGTTAMLEMFGERAHVRTPLVGEHQAHNLAFTLAVLRAAGPRYEFSLAEVTRALSGLTLPGRFHRSGKHVFDVAHNADGTRVLAETMQSVPLPRPVCAVFCALRDKEWQEMLAILRPAVDSLIVTNAPSAPGSRAWNLDDVREFLRGAGLTATVEPDFDRALASAEAATTVLVTGSFHTVGDAMSRLQASPFGT